jgi:hypothetical protein
MIKATQSVQSMSKEFNLYPQTSARELITRLLQNDRYSNTCPTDWDQGAISLMRQAQEFIHKIITVLDLPPTLN